MSEIGLSSRTFLRGTFLHGAFWFIGGSVWGLIIGREYYKPQIRSLEWKMRRIEYKLERADSEKRKT